MKILGAFCWWVNFAEVKISLEARPDLMYSLAQMENAGGAVDIRAVTDNEFVFCDFAKETSQDRRDLDYYQVDNVCSICDVCYLYNILPPHRRQTIGKFG